MKTIAVVLSALFALTCGHAQAQGREAVITFDSLEVNSGETFDFEIRVAGFDSITSAQFGMLWDTSVLGLRGIDFLKEPNGASLYTYSVMPGDLRVIFEGTAADENGVTYSDDTVIGVASFSAVGRSGASTALTPNPQIPLEVVQGASLQRQARIVDGWVHLRAASAVAPLAERRVHVYWPDSRSMHLQTDLSAGAKLCVFAAEGRRVGCVVLAGDGQGELAFDSEQLPGVYYLQLEGAVRGLALPIQGPDW